MSEKEILRSQMQQERRALSEKKRVEAENNALRTLEGLFQEYPSVLSYSSFADEFSTETINKTLLKQGKLFLPRVDGNTLHIYRVQNLTSQLEKHPYGFMEPIPKFCEKVNLTELSMIIVPGVAFDEDRHRLGFGKGYYDRFLRTLPNSVHSYGLGYQAQLVNKIPTSKTDVSLYGLLLF